MSSNEPDTKPNKRGRTYPVHREQGGLKFEESVVEYHVHVRSGGHHMLSLAPTQLINVISAGLPVGELTRLQAGLGVSSERLAPLLGISKATFHRRKGAADRLGEAESDRVVRFARLLGNAIRVFGGPEEAREWLNSPQFGLAGAVPLDYARTEVGAREVENLLGRIEYGVYS